jgi:hypothetical protein
MRAFFFGSSNKNERSLRGRAIAVPSGSRLGGEHTRRPQDVVHRPAPGVWGAGPQEEDEEFMEKAKQNGVMDQIEPP